MGLVSPPLRGSQGIFLGVLFGGLSFPEGPPFWGSSGGSFGLHTWLPTGHDFEKAFCLVRRFVVLKHDLRHFCLFWLGCAPEPALSKDSPPISVRSSEASIPPFLDRPIDVRRGWACPFSLRHTFFWRRWWFFEFSSSPPCRACMLHHALHAMSYASASCILREYILVPGHRLLRHCGLSSFGLIALVDTLRGPYASPNLSTHGAGLG